MSTATSPVRTESRPAAARHSDAPAIVLAALVGAGCGISAFLNGFYDLAQWGPIALVAFVAAVAAIAIVAGRRNAWPTRAIVAVVSLALLGAWALLSSSWAESVDQAFLGAGRWALYAAFFGVMVVLLNRESRQRALLAAGTAGVLVVAVWVVVQMLSGDTSIFLEGRLNEPLGYVNGEAAFFLVAFWPLAAVAERQRSWLLAGTAAAGAAALAALMVLTQSRGVALGALVSAGIVFGVVPGRLQRVALFVLLAVVVVGLGGPLRAVYDSSGGGEHAVTASAAKAGGLQVLVVALAVGVAWGLSRWGLDAYAGDRADRRAGARRVAVGVVVFGVVALTLAGLTFAGRIADRVGDQWHAFTSLQGEGGGQRLESGGGNRYDFWRIALIEAGDHPVAGVGAGNYAPGYFRERRTDQDVRQPHSLPLQTLAELGIVGFGLLVAFVAAVAVGLWRRSRAPAGRAIAIAAGGAFVGWFSESCVDWLALIPGLTGFALCAAAALVAPNNPQVGRARVPRGVSVAGFVAAVALIGFSGYTIGRLTLADADQRAGAAALAGDPRAALRDANDALDLNDASLQALFTKARALAAVNDYAGARATLLSAAAREPHSFTTWSLLGDLALQHGDLRAARISYQRAFTLNPRDAQLQKLAHDPSAS